MFDPIVWLAGPFWCAKCLKQYPESAGAHVCVGCFEEWCNGYPCHGCGEKHAWVKGELVPQRSEAFILKALMCREFCNCHWQREDDYEATDDEAIMPESHQEYCQFRDLLKEVTNCLQQQEGTCQ